MKQSAGFTCKISNRIRTRAFLSKRFLPIVRATLFTGAVMVLSACGGGGGGGSGGNNPAPPAGNGNWDQLVWDQDNWG